MMMGTVFGVMHQEVIECPGHQKRLKEEYG
jgi:hypothetical protein